MLTLKDLLVIENSPEIFDFKFKFDGILMWPFIRFTLYMLSISREYKLVDPVMSKKKLSFTDKMLYLKNTLINNPYKKTLKTKYDILMFCSGITNVKKGSKYFNRISDYFASMYQDRTLLIEDSFRRKYYTPRAFPNVCYHDFLNLEAYMKSKFTKVSEKDVATIKNLLKFLEPKFPYKLDKSDWNKIENILLHISKRLNIYHNLYNKLFDKFNPKAIFLEDASYGQRSYILKWGKARNIASIEPQHGVVCENQPAYNYSNFILNSDIYKEYLPDYFLTYGRYWNESINLPVQKIAIGNPNYSENIKKINISRQNNYKTKILVISGGANPDIIKKLVLDISSIIKNTKYKILFRLHPQEFPALKEVYSEFFARDKIKIDTKQDVYSSLLDTDFVVGEFSAVLFEAIGFCKSIFVINRPETDLYDPKSMFKRFSNAKELMNLIQMHNASNKINRDYIWEPNWEVNYKNFMNNLLGHDFELERR